MHRERNIQYSEVLLKESFQPQSQACEKSLFEEYPLESKSGLDKAKNIFHSLHMDVGGNGAYTVLTSIDGIYEVPSFAIN